jgi:hypothetical protein
MKTPAEVIKGKPCKECGGVIRYKNSGKCIKCHQARNAARKKGKAKGGKVLPPVMVAPPVEIIEPVSKDWRFYADRITTTWRKAVGSIVETGKLLIEAKDAVEHGDWLKVIEELPFGDDAAQQLMAIARHPVVSNTEHVRFLPASWGTLYRLTKVPDTVLLAGIKDHTIHAGMQRKDVALLTGARDPKTKLRRPSKADETIFELTEQMKIAKKHYDAEIEAARDGGFSIDDDEAELARKIVSVIGKGRAELLIVELKKAIARLEAGRQTARARV